MASTRFLGGRLLSLLMSPALPQLPHLSLLSQDEGSRERQRQDVCLLKIAEHQASLLSHHPAFEQAFVLITKEALLSL